MKLLTPHRSSLLGRGGEVVTQRKDADRFYDKENRRLLSRVRQLAEDILYLFVFFDSAAGIDIFIRLRNSLEHGIKNIRARFSIQNSSQRSAQTSRADRHSEAYRYLHRQMV